MHVRSDLRVWGLRALVVVGAVVVSGCQGMDSTTRRSSKAARADRPNVLLITIDTLRADHLGAYGYEVPTSPSIDWLASRGATVEDCTASAPETAPAAASIVTGLYSDGHMVWHNLAPLSESVTTLAELFQESGYTTAGFVGNNLLGKNYGFSQGFDHFVEFAASQTVTQASDPRGASLAADWLRGQKAEPWFVWLHFMDPHGPYNSAIPWWSDDFEYPEGRFGEDLPLQNGSSNFGLGILPSYQVMKGLTRPSQYVRRYDGEIRFTDAQVGAVVATAEQLFDSSNTLTIVSADHGESLTEHDELFQHGWFLYDPAVHVPLMFRWPGVIPEGLRIGGAVSSVDIVPTVLELAGVSPGDSQFAGRSIASAVTGGPAPEPVLRLVSGPRKNSPSAVLDGPLKLIRRRAGRLAYPGQAPGEARREPEVLELYDRKSDPGETNNLAARLTGDVARLLPTLNAFDQRIYESRLRAARLRADAKQ